MAFRRYVSASVSEDLRDERKLCCKSDRCIDLAIEGRLQLMMARCNGGVDVATY